MVDFRPLLDFLRLHAETVVSLDLQGILGRTAEIQVGNITQPTPFMALSSLSGSFEALSQSFTLGMIKGVSLANVDISLCKHIPMSTLLDFFEAASGTLQTANIASGNCYLSIGFGYESIPITRRIVFLCLESFISWCRPGDAVTSVTKEAPVLRTLQVHGLADLEVSFHSTW